MSKKSRIARLPARRKRIPKPSQNANDLSRVLRVSACHTRELDGYATHVHLTERCTDPDRVTMISGFSFDLRALPTVVNALIGVWKAADQDGSLKLAQEGGRHE
jgi:hypothetical protein